MTRVRRGGMKHYENAIPTNAGIIEREQAGHVFCRIKSSAVYRGVPSLPTFGIGSEAQSTNRSINRKKRNLMVPREVHVADSKFLVLILRRKPEEIGISLDEHGWSDVDELVRGISKTRPLLTTCSKRL